MCGLGVAIGLWAVLPTPALPAWWLGVAVVIRVVSGARYAVAVLQGAARPNWMSWSLWGLTAMIAFVAQLTGGAGEEALVTFVLSVTPLVVCVLALVTGRAESGRAGLSAGCAVIAVAGIVLWQLTSNPVLAVAFCIIADLFASLPTVVKAHVDPSSEYPLPYLMSAMAMTVTLLTIQDWRFAVYGFPLYMLLINMTIFSVSSFPVASTLRQTPGTAARQTSLTHPHGEPLGGPTRRAA